ncbi:MAG TPA: carbohydrate kinase family protein [Ferruginibacter sp.]|nr:carbohydrate kinase family protein [Ferruginibacter sp.]
MQKIVICIGASLIDDLFHSMEPMLMHTTNEVTVTRTAGGVSRNIAHQLALLEVPVQLISVFGNDSDGDWLQEECIKAGIKLDAAVSSAQPTGKYTALINKDGSMFTAVKTNAALHLITPQYLQDQQELLNTASFILVDANISSESISWLIDFSNRQKIKLIIETVSVPPAKKLAAINLNGVYLITPNEDELPAICSEAATTLEEQIKELLARGVQNIWLHQGASGSALYNQKETLQLHAPQTEVLDCTGAGDGSVVGFILSKFNGKDNLNSLRTAHTLSAEILQVNGAIISHLNQATLLQNVCKYYEE